MYCTSCGFKIQLNYAFCPVCGQKLSNNGQIISANSYIEKNNGEYHQINYDLLNQVSTAAKSLTHIDGITSELFNIRKRVEDQWKDRKVKETRGASMARKGMIIPCSIVGGITILCGLIAFSNGGWIASLIGAIILVGGVLGGNGLYKLKMPEEADHQYMLDCVKPKIEKLLDELDEYVKENYSAYECIPRDYRTSMACNYFEHCLANGKAHSMEECMKLFDVYAHQLRMEQGQINLFNEMKAKNNMLEVINTNVQRAARSAESAAFYSAMNLFF